MVRYQREWIGWCEAESIDWKDAGPENALRYLQGLEGQRTSGERVYHLSALYEDEADPFASEAVLEWKRWRLHKTKYEPAPSLPGERAEQVMERVRAVRAVGPVHVPVNLTLEEVLSLDDDLEVKHSRRSWMGYANALWQFEDWLRKGGVELKDTVGLHVAKYVHEYAVGRSYATVRIMVGNLAIMFDELRFETNPARSSVVKTNLLKV